MLSFVMHAVLCQLMMFEIDELVEALSEHQINYRGHYRCFCASAIEESVMEAVFLQVCRPSSHPALLCINTYFA